jgi:hypothetical protein
MSQVYQELKISDEDIDAGNAADVIRVFNDAVAIPRTAKTLRGSIFFNFGRFDHDPRPNFVIPEIRRFTWLVDRAHPYFCYFLIEPPEMTQMYSWIMSLCSPIEPITDTAVIKANPGELVDLIVTRLRAVRTLCDRILDDPSPTEEAVLNAMPKPIATTCLRACQPTVLVAHKREAPQ